MNGSPLNGFYFRVYGLLGGKLGGDRGPILRSVSS